MFRIKDGGMLMAAGKKIVAVVVENDAEYPCGKEVRFDHLGSHCVGSIAKVYSDGSLIALASEVTPNGGNSWARAGAQIRVRIPERFTAYGTREEQLKQHKWAILTA